MTGRTLAETGCVHLLAPGYKHGIRCGNQGDCNASADLASVTCQSCLNLHQHGRTGALGTNRGGSRKLQDKCEHTITRGVTGAKGSWCVDCGIKVLEVHDRPCGECKHHRRIDPEGFGGSSICRHHLMAVTPNMLVCYYLVPGPGRGGLCFEAADGQDPQAA